MPELFVTILTLLLLFIVGPILLAAVTRKEKQIKQRNQNKKKRERIKVINEKKVIEQKNKQQTELVVNEKKQENLITSLNKIYSMMNNGIYDIEEFNRRKMTLLESIDDIKIDDPEEFLFRLIPLKEKGIIAKSDLFFVQKRIMNN